MDNTDVSTDVSENQIPDLMKIGEIPTSYGQTLTTDVIDPATFNQNRVRFTLSRVSGFLHSNSKITLAVTPLAAAAGANNAYYPFNIGVSSLIQSATLLVGNKQICAIEDYAQFHAYQSMFISNENNKEREQYLSQRMMNHESIYDSRTGVVTDIPVNAAKTVGLDLGRNPVVAGAAQAFTIFPFQQNDGASAQTISEAPVYSVYLSDLFPFLKTNQLPAFMMDEEIHIDITFQDTVSSLAGSVQSTRMCVAVAGPQAAEFQIDESQVKLVYDSINYDGEIMRQYAGQNQKLVFQYADYRLSKRTGAAAAFSSLTFPIGGNGRLVTKTIFGLQPASSVLARSLVNNYGAAAPPRETKVTTNLLYNDRYLFSTDRSNNAQLFSTTSQAEQGVPMITRDEWQNGGTVAVAQTAMTSSTYEGHAQTSSVGGIQGAFRWTSFRLNRGERINNKGIDLEYNAVLGAGDFTLRAWVELLKVATIENGRTTCYFA